MPLRNTWLSPQSTSSTFLNFTGVPPNSIQLRDLHGASAVAQTVHSQSIGLDSRPLFPMAFGGGDRASGRLLSDECTMIPSGTGPAGPNLEGPCYFVGCPGHVSGGWRR